MSDIQQRSSANILINQLQEQDFNLLQPHLERVSLGLRHPFYESGMPIEHVHFLEDGVGSVTDPQPDGDEIEIGLFGREGLAGTAVLLGVESTPHRSFLQVGDGVPALRIEAHRLSEASRQSADLRSLLLRYVQTFTIQAAQGSAANAHYEVPQRLARWLLMCHDRVSGEVIELTHQFMAMMLGVRRAGVTVALHTLEGTGAIRASRGRVMVVDRERLEEIGGDCYGRPEAEYSQLIAPFGKSGGSRISSDYRKQLS
jgi:CRP-like cAMP-binding protein